MLLSRSYLHGSRSSCMFLPGKILGFGNINDNFSTARLGCTYSTKIFNGNTFKGICG